MVRNGATIVTSELSRRNFLETAGGVAAASALTVAALQPSSAQAAESKPLASKPLRILGICCSPRKGKTTATALQVCLEAAKEIGPGVEVELIELAGLKIPGEVAAGLPLEEGQRDDFPALVPKLSDPQVAGIIIGTPVYFGNMTFLCKAFLDRCIVFHKPHTLQNKVAGVLAVGGGRNCGLELTIRSVQVSLMSQQMIVVGDAPPTGHWGGTVWAGAGGPDAGVLADESGMATAKNLGRRVAQVAMLLSRGTA
jgi:multimeric flavodoxin WrbA